MVSEEVYNIVQRNKEVNSVNIIKILPLTRYIDRFWHKEVLLEQYFEFFTFVSVLLLVIYVIYSINCSFYRGSMEQLFQVEILNIIISALRYKFSIV